MAFSSKSNRIHHVFLSFRGEDVRNNFLGHLYRALDQKGIYTYIDSKKLGKGEQIAPTLMKAIEESQIAIIIFSEDYASSRWCLEEVKKIMDCKEERDLKVFPVFYKVEPTEVRTPKEKYRKAMLKHESKFGKNSEEVKRWKRALSDAASLSGWHLKDGDESELIQTIVSEVSTHLGRALMNATLYVAKHPVGLDPRLAQLKSMLKLDSGDDVLMVGLWGQGGIGKTTLAKAIYNDIFKRFKYSCFLNGVQEVSKGKGLASLQKKFLYEILKPKERLVVASVDAGINQIQYITHHEKVLLILDDVDELCQLNALAGESKWFGNGSRIIITTRDKHLLTGHKIDNVYEVKELDGNAAHELLSKHASLTHQKFKIKKSLVDGVLNHAQGLPLALEVLGSFLCGRREDEWESALDKIYAAPKKDINDVLKISYDGLDEHDRQIFLHIACFFRGRKNEYIKKVLNSCGFKAVIGLRVLIERSLIRMESGNVQMHDLLQLMGMDIVNGENNDPRRRSRLWLYDDIFEVVSSDMEGCDVQAIVFEPFEPTEIHVNPDALTKMRRLRLLILRNVRIQGPKCVPNDLRWFEWIECAPTIPEISSPKKLVGLHMSNCRITEVLNKFKDFQNLKYLNFSDCESLVRMPDLSYTPNLEELDLYNCKNLVEAHESIAHHDKLQVLNLKECSELRSFPNELKAKNLRDLNFENCTNVERFPDIPDKLEGLKNLCLRGTGIKELPISIENLVSLERMFIQYCKKLNHLPSCIHKLQNLEHLQVSYCTNLSGFPKCEDSANPWMTTGLPNLRCLNLTGCNLSEVEFLENRSCCPLLEELHLTENDITTLPPSLGKRDCLSLMAIENCRRLQEIPEVPQSLRYFYAENCEILKKDEDLTLIHRFARGDLDDMVSSIGPRWTDCGSLFPGEEMPQWIVPVEEDSVSFRASKDLYDKVLGMVLCFVHDTQEMNFGIWTYVDGESRRYEGVGNSHKMESDHISLMYFRPSKLWGEVDFGQTDGNYVEFKVRSGIGKWGCRIICKHLEDRLKVELRDHQLITLNNLLYEIGHESTDSVVGSSFMHEGTSSEEDLQEDSQDCPTSIGEHDHFVLNQGPLFSLEARKPRLCVFLPQWGMTVFARCFGC